MSAEDLMNEGKNFLREGNYNDALEKFNQSLEIDPKLPECNFYKGITHQFLSQYDDALNSFNNELSLNPNHVNALISKGTTLCLLDRKEEGIVEFDKALDIEPSNNQALINKSIALQKLNKYDESLQCLNQSIEDDDTGALADIPIIFNINCVVVFIAFPNNGFAARYVLTIAV